LRILNNDWRLRQCQYKNLKESAVLVIIGISGGMMEEDYVISLMQLERLRMVRDANTGRDESIIATATK